MGSNNYFMTMLSHVVELGASLQSTVDDMVSKIPQDGYDSVLAKLPL